MGIFDDYDEEELAKKIYRVLVAYFGRKFSAMEIEIVTEEIMELIENSDEETENELYEE